jgi:hypothetical protein
MTPETFRELLDEETRTPPPPPRTDPLAAGRRRLRRTRLAAGAAAAAVLAVAGGGVALATGGEPTPPPVAVDPTPSADEVALEACRTGDLGPGETGGEVFEHGETRVVTSVSTGGLTLVALEAADARHWAGCGISAGQARVVGFDTEVEPSRVQPSISYRAGCGVGSWDQMAPCPTWGVDLVTRLPAEVAAVRLSTSTGEEWTDPTVDGYAVVNHVAPVPDGGTYGDLVDHPDRMPVLTLTYLDADGRPLAAGSGLGLGMTDPVGDLPPLATYPTLGGPQHVF